MTVGINDLLFLEYWPLTFPETAAAETFRGLFNIPTPRLPIALPANAVLNFEKFTGVSTYNPLTGNDEPTIQTVTIQAALREDKRSSLVENIGLEQNNIPLKGYILSDKALLETFDYRQSVRMTLTDPVTGGDVTGLFQFELVVTPYSQAVEAVAGIPVRGVLRLAGTGEAAI